ncbi:MAG: hypothetical protein ACYS0G_13265 [Planctomycetota bacterium]|jgi:hypothetical protein
MRLMMAMALGLGLSAAGAGPPNEKEIAAVDKPLAEQGYAGLRLRDIPQEHTVVSWIFPGPLQGEGLTAPAFDLARPDLVVAVNDRPMNAEQFKAFVRSALPGDRITIEYRRSRARGGRIPDKLNHEEESRTIDLVLESRQQWTGTVGRPRGHDTTVEFSRAPLLEPLNPANVLGAAVAQHELVEPLKTLLAVFDRWQAKDEDHHALSRVRAGFEHPFRLPELAAIVTRPTTDIGKSPIEAARALAGQNLDVRAGNWQGTSPPSSPAEATGAPPPFLESFSRRAGAMSLLVREALGEMASNVSFAAKCCELLRVPKSSFYVFGPAARDHIEVMRRSVDVDFSALLGTLSVLPAVSEPQVSTLTELATVEVPASIGGAVDGPILGAFRYPDLGWVVVGSAESNRYDMARIAAVVDPAGNDEYYASDLRLGCRVIIDFAGDDLYTGTPGQGPGGALLGVSFIDDRKGNDRYEGELLSAGAAMYGVSLLLDRAGSDTYIGSEWSVGAACYGAGMIVDLSNGADTYQGEFLCQGVGGPRGFGCIVDVNGRDLYRANGPAPSAYGTPAVYRAFSQGVGFGFRHYAAGGVGLISDLGGDDRYEAGEFAQGGAYYYGLGVLHDAAGRDLYYGNRYAQGFGVHQAIGILADDAGDDTYWSMTAASQGAAWDIGVGLLIDKAGNDSYQADGLAQGSASMQAIGMLVDLGGVDRYSARGGACQGRSGGDDYHYHETGAFSFSVLLDLASSHDWYSSGRSDNQTISTGRLDPSRPHASSIHGLFVDRGQVAAPIADEGVGP